jgi:hypothetical protein
MFGLLLNQIPGSETIPWASAPLEEDKRLAWQEAQAAHLLFRAAYQACSKGQTKAFVSKFFGASTASVVVGPKGVTMKPSTTVGTTATAAGTTVTATAKPKQMSINQFMFDGFVVQTIDKAKRVIRKAKEAKETKESMEETKEEPKKTRAKPKNEILLPK